MTKLESHGQKVLCGKPELPAVPTDPARRFVVRYFYVNQAGERCYTDSAPMSHTAASNRLGHDAKTWHNLGCVRPYNSDEPKEFRRVVFPSQMSAFTVENVAA